MPSPTHLPVLGQAVTWLPQTRRLKLMDSLNSMNSRFLLSLTAIVHSNCCIRTRRLQFLTHLFFSGTHTLLIPFPHRLQSDLRHRPGGAAPRLGRAFGPPDAPQGGRRPRLGSGVGGGGGGGGDGGRVAAGVEQGPVAPVPEHGGGVCDGEGGSQRHERAQHDKR